MTEPLRWHNLLEIYQNADWLSDGEADVQIVTESLLETLKVIDGSEERSYEANITVLDSINLAAVGGKIRLRVGKPQFRIGTLADTFGELLSAPGARLNELKAYYIKENNIFSGMEKVPNIISKYRDFLKLISNLNEASLFVDCDKQTAIFFNDKKIDMPYIYDTHDINNIDMNSLNGINDILSDSIHHDSKISILSESVINLIKTTDKNERFSLLMRNISDIYQQLIDGYRLFISSFSYSKIKNDIETAQSEYISKIHKTFSDIQGQLLGLPVATIVIATQFKEATECNQVFWANTGILFGAFIFSFLLIIACINQKLTLNGIESEVNKKKEKLKSDFKEIEYQFTDGYKQIIRRILWHKTIIYIVIGISALCIAFSSIAYGKVSDNYLIQNCVYTPIKAYWPFRGSMPEAREQPKPNELQIKDENNSATQVGRERE